jgi:hypothetical protein
VRRVAAFHQQAEVQPGRAAADTDNAHAGPQCELCWWD